MKYFISLILLLSIYSIQSCTSTQQVQTAFNAEKFDVSNFTFAARTANPTKGRMRILSSAYDVVVKKDTILSFMPYFGESDIAPMTPDETGLRFTSTKYSMNTTRTKDEGWEITIDVNDQKFVNRMVFYIFKNGSATLGVTSNFRDYISFSGQVMGN